MISNTKTGRMAHSDDNSVFRMIFHHDAIGQTGQWVNFFLLESGWYRHHPQRRHGAGGAAKFSDLSPCRWKTRLVRAAKWTWITVMNNNKHVIDKHEEEIKEFNAAKCVVNK